MYHFKKGIGYVVSAFFLIIPYKSHFNSLNLDFTDENIHTVVLKAVSDVLMRTKLEYINGVLK